MSIWEQLRLAAIGTGVLMGLAVLSYIVQITWDELHQRAKRKRTKNP